jgi:nitroimidazol reductase NimA-like FMN-containing flavoprotein (pyridoxamine 5'-phosphate oxidase superfamily)
MTEPWYGKTMGQHDIEEFLNDQATGVLSLSNDGRAYGIPVSFAFDQENGRVIMDLGFAEESKKTHIPRDNRGSLFDRLRLA